MKHQQESLAGQKSPNGVTLAKWYDITDASVDACYCELCNKAIIDVKKD